MPRLRRELLFALKRNGLHLGDAPNGRFEMTRRLIANVAGRAQKLHAGKRIFNVWMFNVRAY